MAKKLTEPLTVADTILFELETPDDAGVLMHDPVAVERIAILYVERNFDKINKQSYNYLYNPLIEKDYKEVKKLAVSSQDPTAIEEAQKYKQKMESASLKHISYFNEATQVFVMGCKQNPVWTAENPMQSNIRAMVYTEDQKEQFGKFTFEWKPENAKEGHYIIHWSWITQSGTKHSDQKEFYLGSDTVPKTMDATRYAPKDKYKILMQRYMPSMYRYKFKKTDLSPLLIGILNKSIAQGFLEIENIANQLMDINDPSLAHESVLPVMANMMGTRLRSDDVTMWRRQIHRAVPLYKRKGTLLALKEALDQAGIRLIKVTKMWQVTSQYNWSDGFVVGETNEMYNPSGIRMKFDSIAGTLSKLPLDISEYEVHLKPLGDKFVKLPKECVRLVKHLEKDEYMVVWNGHTLESPIHLFDKDVVLVRYPINKMPDNKRTIEDYIQSLPLMDQREPTSQKYPPKNWNVKVIEEDDPMLDIIVPTRNGFHDPVVFGRTRTTFLYSEKAYNMDAFDGTLRESHVPCEIDKDFVDTCNNCHSSCFTVDVEIQNLSDDRIKEAIEIINEYSPFHAILHSINVSGSVNEFVLSPDEHIESLVTRMERDTVASNNVLPEAIEYVDQHESIEYEIEWSDGTKENIKV